ncbi:MerR family transcriptional regulator [Bacillus sp. AK031]
MKFTESIGEVMGYSIKEASEMTGLSIDTLRYYDKEGLLPNLKRKDSGYRVFYEMDLETIKTIECFKKSGMQIRDIKRYMDLFIEGQSTLQKRQDILIDQKRILNEKRAELDAALNELEKFIFFTRKAMESDLESKLRDKARALEKKKQMNQL